MSKKAKELMSAINKVGSLIAGGKVGVTVHANGESFEPDQALIEAVKVACVTTCVGILDLADDWKAGELRDPADYANRILVTAFDLYVSRMIDEGDES